MPVRSALGLVRVIGDPRHLGRKTCGPGRLLRLDLPDGGSGRRLLLRTVMTFEGPYPLYRQTNTVLTSASFHLDRCFRGPRHASTTNREAVLAPHTRTQSYPNPHRICQLTQVSASALERALTACCRTAGCWDGAVVRHKANNVPTNLRATTGYHSKPLMPDEPH